MKAVLILLFSLSVTGYGKLVADYVMCEKVQKQ